MGVPQELLFYALNSSIFSTLWVISLYNISSTKSMIASETPYKLAEIYRATWPQLYNQPETPYNGINNFQKSLRNMKFTVYSKDGCPYCTKIQQVLELSKLEHKVYKLNEDFTKDQFYAEFGEGSTFPQVVMEDKHLGGCTDTVKYLQENKII